MGPPSSKAKVLAPAPVSRSTRNVGSSKDAHSEMVADQNQDQNEDQDQDQDPATKAGRLYDFVDRIVNAVSCTCRDVLGMPKMGAKSVGRERSANDGEWLVARGSRIAYCCVLALFGWRRKGERKGQLEHVCGGQ